MNESAKDNEQVEKAHTEPYTHIENYYLNTKVTGVSLKATGLLCIIHSLHPTKWKFSEKGLESICSKDGEASVRSALKELEDAGILVRNRVRNAKGQLKEVEYILQKPPFKKPAVEKPRKAKPRRKKAAQLNNHQSTTQESITQGSIINSYPDADDGIPEERDYREVIYENVEYTILKQDTSLDQDLVDELVELIIEILNSKKSTHRIAGEDKPANVVKAQFLKLRCEHIKYVCDCLMKHNKPVRNVKRFNLTALYNAPMTYGSYYTNMYNVMEGAGK